MTPPNAFCYAPGQPCLSLKNAHAHPQVVPGELTIVTGVPNSGKSEWIDALLCNLARQHGWSFALCSMEKKVCTAPGPCAPLLHAWLAPFDRSPAWLLQVKDHARQLLEKYIGKPFLSARYGTS